MVRGPLAVLVCALALLVAGAAVPSAGLGASPDAAKRTTCKKKSSKRGSRAKSRSKRCKATKKKKVKAKPKPKPKAPATPEPAAPDDQAPSGSPVTARILDGSTTTLDLGRGIVRTFRLSGSFAGYLEGTYKPGTDTAVTLTRGELAVAPTDVLTDSCPAPAISRTNPATSVMLDPTRPSPLLIGAGGAVKLTAHIVIRVVLDLRGASECGGTTTTSGYADTPGTVVVAGQLGAPGLSSFQLGSRLFPLPLRECWSPGTPTTACLTPPTPLWSTGETQLAVSVSIGS